MASIRILVTAGIVLLLYVDVTAIFWSSRRRRRRCDWHWGGWSACSAPCGYSGTQTRHASGCGAPGPETQACNRFCHNGGTALSHSCSCPDEFWNTCCDSLEDVGGGASTNGTPGERAASLPAPRPARRRGAGRPGRRHAPVSGSVTTAGLRVPPLDALVPTGSGTAAVANRTLALVCENGIFSCCRYWNDWGPCSALWEHRHPDPQAPRPDCPDEFYDTCCDKPCTRIANCERLICTSASNHQCNRCNYDRGGQIKAYQQVASGGYPNRVCQRETMFVETRQQVLLPRPLSGNSLHLHMCSWVRWEQLPQK
ncbi:hypothetical protein Bbelb_122510 [Branchiostoma belcheri]|nr:hypothetical protein Bbelb_122510 [Branchiostoma belcheri]